MNLRVNEIQFKNMVVTAKDAELKDEIRELIIGKLAPFAKRSNLNVVVRRYNDDDGNPLKYSANIYGSVDGKEVKVSKVNRKLMASVAGATTTLQRTCRKQKNKKTDKSIRSGQKIKHKFLEPEVEPDLELVIE